MARSTVTGIDLARVEWRTIEEVFGEGGFDTVPGEMACVLNTDPETGASTTLVRLPPGWSTHAPERHSVLQEEILLEGDIDFGSGELQAPAYVCFPAGVAHGPASTRGGAVLLVLLDGPVDVEYLEDAQ